MLIAFTALVVSSIGDSAFTSTVSVRLPIVMTMSTVRLSPARTYTPSRTNFAKPCSSAVTAYSPG